jgi:hypothetical protein
MQQNIEKGNLTLKLYLRATVKDVQERTVILFKVFNFNALS